MLTFGERQVDTGRPSGLNSSSNLRVTNQPLAATGSGSAPPMSNSPPVGSPAAASVDDSQEVQITMHRRPVRVTQTSLLYPPQGVKKWMV